MSDFGIICEVNPLHGGHRYLIESARSMGAERVVCVMSGNTVQRGEFAVTDKYARAEMLIANGADLVLELPFPWSAASAEQFARGGISVLREVCDTIIFGSECGDLSGLMAAAEKAGSEEFRVAFLESLKRGDGSAESYYRLLGDDFSSNDLLGIEYIRAAAELNAPLCFQTIRREGIGYADTEPVAGSYPSAAAIRRLWREGHIAQADSFLPEETVRVLSRVRGEGRMLDETAAERALLTVFRMTDEEALANVAGCEGGLGNRLCRMARRAKSGEELLALCRTKRYTDAHLRRVMLYCLAGVTKEEIAALPSYTTLLAANAKGRALLAEKRKEGGLRVVTKPSDAPVDTWQYRRNDAIDRLYTMITEIPQSADAMLLRSPYIE